MLLPPFAATLRCHPSRPPGVKTCYLPCLTYDELVKKVPNPKPELNGVLKDPCQSFCLMGFIPCGGLLTALSMTAPLQATLAPEGVELDHFVKLCFCGPCALCQMANEVDLRIAAGQNVLQNPNPIYNIPPQAQEQIDSFYKGK
jgi:hypothetical protein